MSATTHTEHGNGEIARAGEILRTVVGSGVHGIAIAGTDDHDEMGVTTPLGEELRALAPAVLSREAVARFLGFLRGQRQRLLGQGRRSGVPNRPELVERYGYDVKYASHALRLALQGREVLRHGRLTLPMPDDERAEVLAVKRGEVPALDDVLARIAAVEGEIERGLAVGDTPLPVRPDLTAVTAWAIHAQQRAWGWA